MKENQRKTVDARIIKDKQKFLEILEKNPVIHIALERSGVTKPTFYRWRDTDKEFAENVEAAMREGKGLISDIAISQLITAIKTNNLGAIKFWLINHHPDYANELHVTAEIKEKPMTPEDEEHIKWALEMLALETKQFLHGIQQRTDTSDHRHDDQGPALP
jgi:hypothetical protein